MNNVYKGKVTHCVHCRREFIPGEFVTVVWSRADEGDEERVFCFSDGFGGCMSKYVGRTGVAMRGNNMYFAVEGELENPRPNYQITPFVPFNEFEDNRRGAVSSLIGALSRVNIDRN